MRSLRPVIALAVLVVLVVLTVLVIGCGGSGFATSAGRPVIVVTTPMLGAVVRSAVGTAADVRVLMPDGADPHEWRPSARDVAEMENADLVVENGLGLEEGITDALARVREGGTPIFTAADHIQVRTIGVGEGADPSDADQAPGAKDPHLWTDPTQMRAVVLALPAAVKAAIGADIAPTARTEAASLRAVDAEVAAVLARVPEPARGIVTGHESLGYFAERYGYRLVGAVTPSLSSQGQVSAAHIAALDRAIQAAGARVVFAEAGTPTQVTQAVADETGATVVELNTHALGVDGTYEAFIRELGQRVSSALTTSDR